MMIGMLDWAAFSPRRKTRSIEADEVTISSNVIVPPAEFDPVSGHDLTELVEVGPAGEVTTWAWVTTPHAKHPLDRPFAWAQIRLDGADTAMLGAVDAGTMSAMATGMRVEPVWADEREGHINDLTHWVLEGGAA